MIVIHRVGSLFCLIALIVSGQNCPTQCFVSVTKNCGDEHFDNSCSEGCDTLNAHCELWVDRDSGRDYSSVDAAAPGQAGEDTFELAQGARHCGMTKLCRCEVQTGISYACRRILNQQARQTNT
jgi:hypothetical protein